MNNNMNILEIEISKLIFPKYNPRKKLKPEDKEYQKIKKSIEEFGYTDLVIINKDNTIISGNQRTQVLMDMGYKKIKVVQIDIDKTKEKALNIALNKITGEWDYSMLGDLLLDLDSLNYDLELTGFDIGEIEDIMAPIEEEKEVVEDDFDIEPPEEPKAKYGDIYQLGSHRLMCGDSTKEEDVAKLMNGNKADMVFTDPPYGMNLDTDYSKLPENKEFEKEKGIKGGKTYKPVIGDNDDFKDELVTTIFNNFDYCKEIFVWGGDYYPELLKDYKKGNYIVWDKKSNEGMENNNFDRTLSSNFELCWSKKKHKKDIVRILWVSAFGTEQEFDHKRVHPTQKPTKLSRWFIDKYSDEGNLIVDIYGGSGSTLIACEQLNRNCYMMELDPHYIDVIIQRWENFTGKKAIKIEGDK